jgi:hypothetical protein
MYKQIEQYFKNHAMYNASVHIILGIGLGMLLTYPLAGAHPVRWGLGFIILGILGHIYPLAKKG